MQILTILLKLSALIALTYITGKDVGKGRIAQIFSMMTRMGAH
jgi:hypothetical protein